MGLSRRLKNMDRTILLTPKYLSVVSKYFGVSNIWVLLEFMVMNDPRGAYTVRRNGA